MTLQIINIKIRGGHLMNVGGPLFDSLELCSGWRHNIPLTLSPHCGQAYYQPVDRHTVIAVGARIRAGEMRFSSVQTKF